jgi:hypothetical protein
MMSGNVFPNAMAHARKQSGLLLNPFRFGGGGGDEGNVTFLMHCDAVPLVDELGNTFTTSGTITTEVAPAGFGNEIVFVDNGMFAHANLSNEAAVFQGDGCLEFFATFTSLGSRYLMSMEATDNGNYLYLQISSSGQIGGSFNGSGIPLSAAGVITQNTRHFIKLERDATANELRILVDGNVTNTISNSAAAPTGAVKLWLNRAWNLNFGGFRFAGKFDEIRITQGSYRPDSPVPTAPFPNP